MSQEFKGGEENEFWQVERDHPNKGIGKKILNTMFIRIELYSDNLYAIVVARCCRPWAPFFGSTISSGVLLLFLDVPK